MRDPKKNSPKDKMRPVSDFHLTEETLAALRGRDPDFLGTLFSQTNPFLLRICIANSILNENADDVIHQTWETFFTNLDQFERRSQIRTFICGILFNKIREYRRALAKTQYEEDSEVFMNQAFTLDGWWKMAPQAPDRIFEMRQSAEMIGHCLEGLTEQQKTAFFMKEVEDEDPVEICSLLNVNVNHLRVLLFRAKDKLRKCMEGRINSETV